MLDLEARQKRLIACKSCSFWSGSCRKGHPGIMSNLGCPLARFSPLHGASYAPDREVLPRTVPKPCRPCPDPNRVGSWSSRK